jgi:hypothetical protein
MEILLFIVVFGALASFVLFNLYRRAKQIHQLLNEGVPAQGTLFAKRRITQKGRARFIFSYEYEADGRQRKGRSVVSREVFDAHAEGQALAVRYLANKPSVSAPEFVLEKARQDLKR